METYIVIRRIVPPSGKQPASIKEELVGPLSLAQVGQFMIDNGDDSAYTKNLLDIVLVAYGPNGERISVIHEE